MRAKLRDVQVHAIEHQGQQMLLLRDPLQLGEGAIAVPRAMGLLLGLMDGTRDEAALEAALQVRAGVRLAPGLLDQLLTDLDRAYLLDNEHYAQAKAAAADAYRQAPFRPATMDGAAFSPRPELAATQLQAYMDQLPPAEAEPQAAPIRGLVSPHIDYQRGGAVYAGVWRAAAQAAREAELAIVLGTDHQGSPGTITATRQSYATPWGVLPTDQAVVDALVEALGDGVLFDEELHHRGEHSIELAVNWLHFVRDGEPVPLVPLLCGSFGAFVEGYADPAAHEIYNRAIEVLRQALSSRRALVIAAADLAHVGPAFGDPHGVDYIGRAQLRKADDSLLETVYRGDAAAFFEEIKGEGDRRNICGLPPIYLTLRILDGSTGQGTGYDLCPADPQGTSFVTIAGVTLH
ncbi:MAG: AmmeMemoRadiSam system protein B [Anaerolineae bacterium]